MIIENSERVEAGGIGAPAVAARRDTGEPPARVVPAAEFGFFGDEQAQEGARNVAEADDGEIVGRHGGVSGRDKNVKRRFANRPALIVSNYAGDSSKSRGLGNDRGYRVPR